MNNEIRELEVLVQLNMLDTKIDDLQEQIAVLYRRLDSVLSVQYIEENNLTEGIVEKSLCNLAEHIRLERHKVEGLSQTITVLLEKLEI